jgi:hypothetical protein
MSLRILGALSLALLLLVGCDGSGGSGGSGGSDASAEASGKLNDTGIDWFADADSNNLADEPAGFEGQDASYGRDARARAGTLEKVGGGAAGFDFTKLDDAGQPLADQSVAYADTPWACVRDNVTGLVWEVKTDDDGLRDRDSTYTWYNEDATNNGGEAGTADGGYCSGGIDCDTAAYVAAVNAAGLCGASDWRLPTLEELRSIVDYGVAYPGPTIDAAYFPNAQNGRYWSASPYAGYSGSAWGVGFYDGHDPVNYKSYDDAVRLVRGGQ